MSSYSLNVATWNQGRHWDWQLLNLKQENPRATREDLAAYLQRPDVDTRELARKRMQLLQRNISQLKQQSDGIVMMQEVGFQPGRAEKQGTAPALVRRNRIDRNHDFIRRTRLPQNNWAYSYDGQDCLIAWDQRRFTRVNQNGSPLFVDLRDNTTQKIVRVASAHIKGFSLGGCPHRASRADGAACGAELGDRQVKGMRDALDSRSGGVTPDVTIVGGDFNTNRDIHPARLKTLTDAGYAMDQTDRSHTGLNPDLGTARLDHVFAKAGRNGQQVRVQSAAARTLPINNLSVNPSDHIPVIKTVQVSNRRPVNPRPGPRPRPRKTPFSFFRSFAMSFVSLFRSILRWLGF